MKTMQTVISEMEVARQLASSSDSNAGRLHVQMLDALISDFGNLGDHLAEAALDQAIEKTEIGIKHPNAMSARPALFRLLDTLKDIKENL